jgi:hypothetical protein
MVLFGTLCEGEWPELLDELLTDDILHMLDFLEPRELGLLGGVVKLQVPFSQDPFKSNIT